MKLILTCVLSLSLQCIAFGQTIEGDRLLDVVGKPVTDLLFQDLKKQEVFYTDAWDEDFTIYISRTGELITEVELENGKLRYGSKTERYGYYQKKLPLGLSWNMSAPDFSNKLGAATLVSTNMNFSDYNSRGWAIRIFYENGKPVSIAFKKTDGITPIPAPVVKNPASPNNIPPLGPGDDWLMKVEPGKTASFNLDVFRNMINDYPTLNKFAGIDSVDYIGQMYYSSKIKMQGFDRVAIKRKKQQNKWHFEAFMRLGNNDKQVSKTFLDIYNAIKASVKSNYGDDFIFAAVIKDSIRRNPMNWLAQWTLYSNYKGFRPGLGKLRLVLLLTGMQKFMKPDEMEYTLKIYICDADVEVDFFTWDTPK